MCALRECIDARFHALDEGINAYYGEKLRQGIDALPRETTLQMLQRFRM